MTQETKYTIFAIAIYVIHSATATDGVEHLRLYDPGLVSNYGTTTMFDELKYVLSVMNQESLMAVVK